MLKKKSQILYFTHCSAKKDDRLKGKKKATTPDKLYIGGRIQCFINWVNVEKLEWAIFSDEYGFVFSTDKIKWYDTAPDNVDEEEVEWFVNDKLKVLSQYEKIIYLPGDLLIHPTYYRLIRTMTSKCLGVVVEYP